MEHVEGYNNCKIIKNFPSYEYIKNLQEYEEIKIYFYTNSSHVGKYRFTYNEDNTRCMTLDFLVDGYLHYDDIPSKYIKINKFYKLNKKNYDNIIKEIKYKYKYLSELYTSFYEQLQEDFDN